MNRTQLNSTTNQVLASDITVLRAPIYYRWSTPGQIKEKKFRNNRVEYDEKKIIAAEVENLKKAINNYHGYCSKCNKEIRTVFTGVIYLDKARTGRKLEREEVSRLMDDAKESNFQAVFTKMASRLGRNGRVTRDIRDNLKGLGIQVYALHQPVPLECPECFDPLDNDSAVIIETMSDMQSELELSAIRRNYQTGMPLRIKKGKPAGSLAYGLVKGYKVLGKDIRGDEQIEEYYKWDEDKTNIAKRIAGEFLGGSGTWSISKGLNDDGILSPRGKSWGRSAILHILKNPIYAGLVRFGWKISKRKKRIITSKDKWMMEKACFDGIWPPDYYEKIQDELARRRKVGGRAVSSEALLIGLLKCGFCGYSMFQARGSKPLKDGTIYHWNGYGCGKFLHGGTCQHNGIKQDRVDKTVLNEVLKLASDDTKKAFHQELSKKKSKNLETTLKERKIKFHTLNNQFIRISEAYNKGIDTLEEYATKKKELLPLIETTRNEVTELEGKVKSIPQLTWNDKYELAVRKFLDHPNMEDKKEVKTILNRLIDTIEIKAKPKPFHIKINYKFD